MGTAQGTDNVTRRQVVRLKCLWEKQGLLFHGLLSAARNPLHPRQRKNKNEMKNAAREESIYQRPRDRLRAKCPREQILTHQRQLKHCECSEHASAGRGRGAGREGARGLGQAAMRPPSWSGVCGPVAQGWLEDRRPGEAKDRPAPSPETCLTSFSCYFLQH